MSTLSALALGLLGLLLLALAWRHARGLPPLAREQLSFGGLTREFSYRLSAAHRPGQPLLLVLHGGAGSIAQMRRYSGCAFEALAETQGYAVAYLQAHGGYWNSCQRGRNNAATRLDVDDVGFVRAVRQWFIAQHGVSAEQVYALGFSNGGHLCFRLAQEMGEELAGLAVIAANRPAASDCKCEQPNRAVPLLLINGTADPINPYQGGQLSPYGLRSLGPVQSALETAASFAPVGASLSRSGQAAPRGSWVERHAWRRGGQDCVVLLTVHGGGHTIPRHSGAMPLLFGRTSHALDAAQECVRFFNSVPALSARLAQGWRARDWPLSAAEVRPQAKPGKALAQP